MAFVLSPVGAVSISVVQGSAHSRHLPTKVLWTKNTMRVSQPQNSYEGFSVLSIGHVISSNEMTERIKHYLINATTT